VISIEALRDFTEAISIDPGDAKKFLTYADALEMVWARRQGTPIPPELVTAGLRWTHL